MVGIQILINYTHTHTHIYKYIISKLTKKNFITKIYIFLNNC